MKKYLILGILVFVLGMASSAFAQIGPQAVCGLSDLMGTDKLTYEIGDTACFEIQLTATCDINDVNLYFWDPCNADVGQGHCDTGNNVFPGGVVIALGLDLKDGEVVDFNCLDNPALAHLVTEDNYPLIIGSIGTESTVVGQGQACDTENVQADVNPPEACIEITKDVNCATALPGKTVTYTICLENCGASDIDTITSVDDTLLGNLTSQAQAAIGDMLNIGDVCCFDYDYTIPGSQDEPVQNQVSVSGEDVFDQAVDDTSDIVWVQIADPNFTASKVCREEPVVPGEMAIFDITIENTGDICLHFDVCDIDPCSFDLEPGQTKTYATSILAGDEAVENTLTGTATLCEPNECIPYEEEVLASAECEVQPPEPCIEITKDVNCATALPGKTVTYTICIENCGPTDINTITSVDDTLLGDLTSEAQAAVGDKLEIGDVCCFDYDYTIPTEQEEPVQNQVSVNAEDVFDQAVDDTSLPTKAAVLNH
ncbi:MAG: hypothetical protein ACYTE8_06045 [Planctomycetota bacterium]